VNDSELRIQTERLNQLLFAPQSAQLDAWSGHALYHRVDRVRTRRRYGQKGSDPRSHGALPLLNPYGETC
ncbi:MAG: hypothetical protein V3S24_15605, partial [Candidatus Tectomicrobia bacterium]